MTKKLKLLLLLLTLCVGQALAQESNLALFFCGVNVPKGYCENGRRNLVPHINDALLSMPPYVYQPNNQNGHATVWGNVKYVNDYGIYYAPDSKKLTLKNISIEVGYDGMSHVIKAYGPNGQLNSTQNLELCLEGENEITIYYENSGLQYFFRDNVKLSGSGSLKVYMSAKRTAQPLIAVGGDLTTDSGFTGSISLSACNNSGANIARNVTVKDDYMILADSWSGATIGQEDEKNVLPGHSYDFTYDTHDYRFLGVAPVKKFDLYIANKQVDYTNMTDVFGDGTVSYDRASKTLILNNATIDCPNVTTNDNAVISTKGYWFTVQNTEPVVEDISGILKVKLVGDNVINGNAEIGFENSVGLSGPGNLTMNISNSGDAYGFGRVVCRCDFSGWVSVNTNPGESGTGKAVVEQGSINLPSNTGYFASAGDDYDHLTSININSTTVSGLDKRYAVFGAESAINNYTPQIYLHPTNSDNPLTKVAYVGKTISAKQCYVRANGGQAPYRYSSSTLPAGLTIDPNTGIISGTYSEVITAADIKARPYIILKVTDRLGHYNEVTEELREVKPAMTLTDDPSLDLPDMLCGQAITPIACGPFKTNGENWKFSAVGLPEGITIAEHTGAISGIPTVVNNQPSVATITVTDELGQKASIEINVGRVFENYEFNVAGTLVTGINKDDILGTSGNQGVCSYDHANKTLVLNNFHYDGSCSTFIDDTNGAVETIRVIGENSINMTGAQDYSYLIQHDINVTGSINGSVLPKLQCEVDHEQYHRMYGVKGNVTVIDDVILEIFAPSGAILGTLNVPANQIIHTGNQKDKSDAVAHNETSYKINNPMVFTSRLENGALRFTNKNEGKTVFNTIPVKPFTMFDVEGGVAPYTYSVSALPSGLTFDTATGTISGTSVLNSSSTSVTFTVTDGMAREVSTEIDWVVKNPTLTMNVCGGTTDRTATNRNWGVVLNTAGMLQKGQLLLVDTDFDFEETLLTIPNNMVVRDVNGKTYANNITLEDGVKYAFPCEVDANSISYTRTFSDKVAGKWQCLYVPFDITVTNKLLEDFDFAKLYMVSYDDENNNGEIEDGEPLVMLLKKQSAGMVLHANTPYFIKAKTAGTKSIVVESATLKSADNGTVYCCTTEHGYTLKGVYDTFNINGYYTMGTSGGFSHYTTDTNLKSNRWYMKINSLNGEESESVAEARKILIMVDGEDDTTGLINITSGSKIAAPEGIFTLDGRKVNETEKLSRGIYIKNGKKIFVK